MNKQAEVVRNCAWVTGILALIGVGFFLGTFATGIYFTGWGAKTLPVGLNVMIWTSFLGFILMGVLSFGFAINLPDD